MHQRRRRQHSLRGGKQPEEAHHSIRQQALRTIPTEVLTFNLVWDKNPKPTEILKLMFSLPERLSPSDMFSYTDQKNNQAYYVLKGMVCFHAAHYLAFFRRILIKFDYLEVDYKTLDADFKEMNSEITP